MAVIILDEHLADVLDEPHTRRGWWLDVRQEQDEELVRQHERDEGFEEMFGYPA